MTSPGDYYRILQVDPSADYEVVEAAFRRLARKYHPDLNPGEGAGATMRQLNEAYAVLKDPARRAEYDRQRAGQDPDPARRASGVRSATAPTPAATTVRVRRPRRAAPEPPPPTPSPSMLMQLARNRVVITTALSLLLAAAIFAALASTLFIPSGPADAPEASPASIVVVNRQRAPEPTPTMRVRVTATTEPWPPFPLDRPVQATERGENAGPPDASALGSFLSRAGQELRRRVLGGPRPPAPPPTPTGPG